MVFFVVGPMLQYGLQYMLLSQQDSGQWDEVDVSSEMHFPRIVFHSALLIL